MQDLGQIFIPELTIYTFDTAENISPRQLLETE